MPRPCSCWPPFFQALWPLTLRFSDTFTASTPPRGEVLWRRGPVLLGTLDGLSSTPNISVRWLSYLPLGATMAENGTKRAEQIMSTGTLRRHLPIVVLGVAAAGLGAAAV